MALGEQGERVWRFALPSQTASAGHEDPLVEMVRSFLDDFLNIGYLTNEGRRVNVDGFRFVDNPEEEYEIFLSNAQSGNTVNQAAPSGKPSPDRLPPQIHRL